MNASKTNSGVWAPRSDGRGERGCSVRLEVRFEVRQREGVARDHREQRRQISQRAFGRLVNRRDAGREDVEKAARKIIENVRDGGDAELLAAVRKYDAAKVSAVEVTPAEWNRGVEAVDPADRAALGKAAMRVREFHRKRIPSSWEMKEEGGAFMGVRVRPLARVGLYAPGGKAAYPSTVIMSAVPASVVEVPEICLATPPRPDGTLPPEILMAARLAGVHRVFKMGGAQAIAALRVRHRVGAARRQDRRAGQRRGLQRPSASCSAKSGSTPKRGRPRSWWLRIAPRSRRGSRRT